MLKSNNGSESNETMHFALKEVWQHWGSDEHLGSAFRMPDVGGQFFNFKTVFNRALFEYIGNYGRLILYSHRLKIKVPKLRRLYWKVNMLLSEYIASIIS